MHYVPLIIKAVLGEALPVLKTVNLNPPVYTPPPLPPIIFGILVSWALGTYLEVVFWKVIIFRRIGKLSYFFTLGSLALIQVASTPLSYGFALIVNVFLRESPLQPDYFNILYVFLDINVNPIGLIVGFLILPIIVEWAIWQHLVKYIRSTREIARTPLPNPPKTQHVLSTSLLANSFSFMIGFILFANWHSQVLLQYGSFSSMFVFLGVFSVLILPLVFIVFRFLTESQPPDSQRLPEDSEQSIEESKSTEAIE